MNRPALAAALSAGALEGWRRPGPQDPTLAKAVDVARDRLRGLVAAPRAGVVVAISATTPVERVALVLAAWHEDLCPMVLDPRALLLERGTLAAQCGARVLLADEGPLEFEPDVVSVSDAALLFTVTRIEGGERPESLSVQALDRLLAAWGQAVLDGTSGDVGLLDAALSTDALVAVLATLKAGRRCLVLGEAQHASARWDRLMSADAQVLVGEPDTLEAALVALEEREAADCSPPARCVSLAGPVSAEARATLRRRCPETTVLALRSDPERGHPIGVTHLGPEAESAPRPFAGFEAPPSSADEGAGRIRRGGETFMAADVARALRGAPGVVDAHVAWRDGRLLAWVVFEGRPVGLVELLQRHMRASLPGPRRPDRVLVTATLNRGPDGVPAADSLLDAD
ncbi:MAG: hypothetical protein ACOYM9_07885 [Bradymonadia bacterium]|jgi:hypothetical protein